MPRTAPETFIDLSIEASANSTEEYAAAGPHDWANLIVETALQSGQDPNLLDRLKLGNVAVGVMFAPENWRAAASYPARNVDYGGVRSEGNSLTVSLGAVAGDMNHVAVTFRRPAVDQPYRPVTHEDKTGKIQFPEDTRQGFPENIGLGLHSFWVAAEGARSRLAAPEEMRRWVPYVRISDL